MEKIKCKVCNKRYITQNEWKTKEEKENCMTCLIIKRMVTEYTNSFKIIALSKGLDLSIKYELKPR